MVPMLAEEAKGQDFSKGALAGGRGGGETAAMQEAIHVAALRNDAEAMRRLLDEDPTLVSVPDPQGGGASPLLHAAFAGGMQTVRLLCERGAVVDAHDPGGMNPLFIASCRGHVNVVAMLLSMGADPDLLIDGMTALMVAAAYGRLAVVLLLLDDKRCQINKADEEDATALVYACLKGQEEVARVLLMRGGEGPRGMAMFAAMSKGHVACIQLLKWFEGERERMYCLIKARQVEDGMEAVRLAPLKAQSRTRNGAQQAREEAVPAFLRGRVERRELLPAVVVWVRGKRKRKRPEADVEEEVIKEVLQYVVYGSMKGDLVTELMEMMHYRR